MNNHTPALTDAIEAAREALTEFRQQDDYLLAHNASLMSEDSHEILHVDTLEKIVRAALAAAPAAQPRPCTCHPDDNPPQPCAQKYALSECRAAQPDHFADVNKMVGAQPAAPQGQPEPFGWVKSSEIEQSKRHGGSINLWREKWDCDVPVFTAPPAPDGWISVKDRLPEVGQRVIVYRPTAAQTNDHPISMTEYTGRKHFSWQEVRHGFDCICHPTHWMPLPAAPSAGEQP